MNTVRVLDFIALLFIIIGAINWGLIGFFQLDVVATLFGGATTVASRVVYAIVGISGIYGLTFFEGIRDRAKGIQ